MREIAATATLYGDLFMTRSLSILPLSIFVLTGCGHVSSDVPDAKGQIVKCYWGESRMVLPNGRRISKYQTLVRRVLVPKKMRIGESVAALMPNRPQGVHVVGIVVKDDNTFRFKLNHGGAEGTGKLVGEPWRWHSWKSTTKISGGSEVETSANLKDGVLRAEKRVLSATGELQFTITDRLPEIGLDECENRFKRIKHNSKQEVRRRCQFACAKLKRCESNLGRDTATINHKYCRDKCVRGKASRAFRCVIQTQGPKCQELASCIKGADID